MSGYDQTQIPKEVLHYARKECKCCPECNQWPCEGSVAWNGMCDRNPCDCEQDADEDTCLHGVGFDEPCVECCPEDDE